MRWGNNNVPLCNVRYNIIYEKNPESSTFGILFVSC